MIKSASTETGDVMSIEAGLVLTGSFVFVGILFALTLVSAKRQKQRGTSIWDPPPKQSGVSANWKWLAIGLAAWALFSGGRFFTFSDQVAVQTIDANGDKIHYEISVPHSHRVLKARFVLPNGQPAESAVVELDRHSNQAGMRRSYDTLASTDSGGNLIVRSFDDEGAKSTFDLYVAYRDATDNTLYQHHARLDFADHKLLDLGQITLGSEGHELRLRLFFHGEPYHGRAVISSWENRSSFGLRLTGTGPDYRIVGLRPVVSDNRTLQVELLDAQYEHGRSVSQIVVLSADDFVDGKADITVNLRSK